MVEHFGCEAMIFTGHSLGGAVSHLSCLWAKRQDEFKQLKLPISSVAFAAPLAACEEVARDVERLDWTSHFVNIVNGDDPVPRLLNLAESLAELCRAGSDLSRSIDASPQEIGSILNCLTGKAGLSTVLLNFLPSAPVADALQRLAMLPAAKSIAKVIDIYKPFGIYVFLRAPAAGPYECTWSRGMEVLEELGPAKLLDKSFKGNLTNDNIRRHDVSAYKLVLNHRPVKEFLDVPVPLEPSRSVSSGSCTTDAPSPMSVASQVNVVSVKVFSDLEKNEVLYGIIGKNLDLLGTAGMELFADDQFQVAENIVPVLQEDTFLTLQQQGLDQSKKLEDSKRLRFRPDVGPLIEFPLNSTDFSSSRSVDMGLARDADLRFDKNFVRRTLKQAWLMEHYVSDTHLLQELVRLDQLGQFGLMDHYHVSKANAAEALCHVGEGEDAKKLIQATLDWICPPGGLKLPSKKGLFARGILTVAGFAGVTAAFVYSGGLSLLLPSVFPATGGYLTGGVSSLAFLMALRLSDDRLPFQYNQMLAVLLEEAGCSLVEFPAFLRNDEFDKEKRLIELVEVGKVSGVPQWVATGRFVGLRSPGLQEVNRRYEAVRIIHNIKETVCIPTVFVSGPANSGKTTLVSQLLMSPELEQGAGYMQECRTQGVNAHKWGQGALVIDTPGLDAAQDELVGKFRAGACAAKAYVYIRSYQGLEQGDDVKNIVVTLDQAASPSPHVLILLNQVIEKRRLATGEKLSKQELLTIKKTMLANMKEEFSRTRTKKFEGTRMGNFFSTFFNSKFTNVEIMFADLSRTREEIDSVAEDIRDLVLDARGVANWCQKVLDPKKENDHLQRAVNQVNWTNWVQQCQAARQRREEEREAEAEAQILAASGWQNVYHGEARYTFLIKRVERLHLHLLAAFLLKFLALLETTAGEAFTLGQTEFNIKFKERKDCDGGETAKNTCCSSVLEGFELAELVLTCRSGSSLRIEPRQLCWNPDEWSELVDGLGQG